MEESFASKEAQEFLNQSLNSKMLEQLIVGWKPQSTILSDIELIWFHPLTTNSIRVLLYEKFMRYYSPLREAMKAHNVEAVANVVFIQTVDEFQGWMEKQLSSSEMALAQLLN